MAYEDMKAWPVESIPDGDDLFIAVHRVHIREGAILPGVFRDHGMGMSSDWSKYSTPQDSRSRRKSPSDNAIIALQAGAVRAIRDLSVVHDPIPSNRAHAEIVGEKSTEVRFKLLQFHRQIIPLDAP